MTHPLEAQCVIPQQSALPGQELIRLRDFTSAKDFETGSRNTHQRNFVVKDFEFSEQEPGRGLHLLYEDLAPEELHQSVAT